MATEIKQKSIYIYALQIVWIEELWNRKIDETVFARIRPCVIIHYSKGDSNQLPCIAVQWIRWFNEWCFNRFYENVLKIQYICDFYSNYYKIHFFYYSQREPSVPLLFLVIFCVSCWMSFFTFSQIDEK